MISDRSRWVRPASPSTTRVPASTASSGARGVVRSLRLNWAPSTSKTKSVNVPPISTASRAELMKPASCLDRLLDITAEIGFANARVVAHCRGRPFHEFAAELHHDGSVGDEERTVHVLLNDEHGHSLACNIAHRSED